MTTQPVFDEPGPDDPAQILRGLAQNYHAGFLAEYAEAVEKARRPREIPRSLRCFACRACVPQPMPTEVARAL